MAKRLRTLDDVEVAGKRVIVRADYNVATGKDGTVSESEDFRIRTSVPTLKELREKGAKVLILPRRGRDDDPPEGLDLAPVHKRLEELLGESVRRLGELTGDAVVQETEKMQASEVVMLPNVRGDPREAQVNEQFAIELAELADVYVNEAFGEAHRAHTSLTLLAQRIVSVAGRRVQLEIEALAKVAGEVPRPYVVLASGAKLEDKIGMLRSLAERADVVCVGGKIANVFLAAAGKLDPAQFRADDVAAAQSLIAAAKGKLRLPRDIVTGSEDGQHYVKAVPVEELPKEAPAWDIGPETVKEYLTACAKAKTIIWNGPMGRCEVSTYCAGTRQLAQTLAKSSAYRVVGGGDTVTALHQFGLADTFDHMSVGGGAMIALLEGKRMPALEPLYAED